uniref:Alkylated DNA repair protein AlkB homologue 8 N-terminal domain-containing protein n=1 Tax=Knipowitschia caucasica TaxID=637954 RepID=A0AAV2M0M6_KNICA
MEEFQSYFTDGILSKEQMQELYFSIDRQRSDNLDIDQLSEYFSPHLGEYVNVLSALEKLNVAILKAMDKTKEFAYRANRSVDDAINLALHHILQHLDSPGTYARVLFVDFSSAFNTILPPLLQDKLSQLNVPDSTCSHDSVKLIKFADDTTLIGLISNNDESAYRREVDRLVSWCSGNNLELNAQKTVEMIVDFRKSTVPPPPPSVMDSPITSVESFRFLGTTITQDLKWEPTISSLIKKAQQRMYFLRQLRKAKLPAQMLVQFYTAIIESILTSSITVWFAGATVRDKQRLQRIVRSAEEVIGRSLPSLQDLRKKRRRMELALLMTLRPPPATTSAQTPPLIHTHVLDARTAPPAGAQ